MTYPLLKSIYAEAVKLEHPAVPSAVAVAAAAAHDLKEDLTIAMSAVRAVLPMLAEDKAARLLLVDAQSALQRCAWRAAQLGTYAERQGAKPSARTLEFVLEDLRDT